MAKKFSAKRIDDHDLSQALFIGLCFLVFLVPLAFSPQVFRAFSLTKITVLLIGAVFLTAGLLVQLLTGSAIRIRWSFISLTVVAFIGLATASHFGSVHRATSFFGDYQPFEGIMAYLSFAALYFLASQIGWRPARLRQFAQALAAGAGLVAAYGLLQYLGADFLSQTVNFSVYRSASTFGNPTLLAGYLVLVFPIALVLFLTAESTFESALFGPIALLIFVVELTTFARGGWLALAVTAVLLLVKLGKIGGTRKVWAIASLALILLLMAVFSSLPGEADFAGRLTSSFRLNEGGAGTRIEIWKGAARLIAERPVFGHGPDVFGLVFPKYQSAKLARSETTMVDNAHNYFLQIATTLGIPAAMVFALLLISHFWSGAAALKRLENDRAGPFVLALLVGGLGYSLTVMFEPAPPGATFILWIMLGIVASRSGSRVLVVDWPRPASVNLRRVAAVGITILAATGVFFISRIYLADTHFRTAEQLRLAGDHGGAISYYQQAILINPRVNEYSLGLAEVYRARREQTGSQTDFDFEKEALEQAVLNNPYRLDNLTALAEADIFAADRFSDRRYFVEAQHWLDKAVRLGPNSAKAFYVRGTLEFYRGRSKRAVMNFERAAQLNPSDAQAYYGLGLAWQKLGRSAKAEAAFKKTLALDSSFSEARQGLLDVGGQ